MFDIDLLAGSACLVLGTAMLGLLLSRNRQDLARQFEENLYRIWGGRGGPGSPSHPLPANDSTLLNGKSSKNH